MNDTRDLQTTIHDLAGRRGVFRPEAYLFVLEAFATAAEVRPERGYVGGEDVLDAVRRLGQERFGVMAPDVFRAWGVRATIDFGRAVFHLAEAGLLPTRQRDPLSEFVDKFDFEDAFSLKVMRARA